MSKKYDITWIMQVYLGEYENAPKDSAKKFKRAVKSFLAMKDERTQLVIVSDGCQEAHTIYFKDFAKYENIKYIFLEKTTPKMNDEWNGDMLSRYQRVAPRQLARQVVEGNVVAYLDADDFLLPNASEIIRKAWRDITLKGRPVKWAVTNRWYDSEKIDKYINNTNYHGDNYGFGSYSIKSPAEKIKGLTGKWYEMGLDEDNKIAVHACNFTHMSNLDIKWRDSIYDGSTGKADNTFWVKLKSTGDGFMISKPYYVRCHHSNLWDM